MIASLLDAEGRGAKRSPWAALAAMFWLAESCCLPSSLWAQQRRKAEPEANPQFQQDVQSSPQGQQVGQPVDSGFGNQGANPGLPSRSSIQSVQIGETPEARPAPAPPSNPLDIRVSVRVKDAPLAVFLETISAQAKVNFLISEEVQQKKVTAFLQNVSVREALQMLLEIKGLTYQQIGKSNTYIIAPRSKAAVLRITRIYSLNYIPLIPVLDAQGGTAGGSSGGGQMTSGLNLGQLSGGGGGAGGAQGGFGGGAAGAKGSVDSGIYIFNVINSIKSKEGNVSIDPRTNSLIVTDIPDVFPQIEQIIAELDKKAPQVVIEAQIVEIDSDKTQNLGLEWGSADGTIATFTGPQRDTTFPLNLPRNLGNSRLFEPLTSVVSNIGGGSGGTNSTTAPTGAITTTAIAPFGSNLKTGIVDLSQLTVVLRALVSRAEARFLGKPKVLTINNKQATIEISQDQAISQSSQSSQSGQGTPSLVTTQPERKQTGLKLRVTPQVNKEGYITLLVDPEFVDVQLSSVGTISAPIFDTVRRATHTLVRIKNGQTLVLGGLLKSTETKVVRKVPFFGYIPIIGWFFTGTRNERKNTDLVIFLTPTIVND